MTGKNYYKLIQGLVLIGILFTLASCGEDERSIFWTIINAREEEDYSLDNNISVIAMTDDETNYYISAGGSVWWQEMTLDDNEWKKVKIPGKASFCTAIEYYNSTFYAAFILESGIARLYSTTNPAAGSPTWTRVVDPLIRNKQIIKFMAVNSRLFISVLEPPIETEEDSEEEPPYTFSLFYLNGANFNEIHPKMTSRKKPVIDICWNGTNYWATSGEKILEFNESLTTAIKIKTIEHNFSGILYQFSSGRHYVSSERGNVYIYDGSDWESLKKDELIEIDGKIVSFTDVMKVNGNILVGTQGYGFFEMRDGTLDSLKRAGADNDMNSILSIDLYNSHIISFYKTYPDLIFFCTGGDGLYHNTFDGDRWSEDWVRE